MSSGDFIEVADISDVSSGQIKGVEVDGRKLIISNFNGQFYAMDGVCAHAGGPLCKGELDGRVVVCPWHGWEYDVETGLCDVEPTLKQQVFAVRIDEDKIMVSLT